MAKLFPPTIPGKLPAAYADGSRVKFRIPFQHNEAITDNSLYDSFSLKIKTVSTNKDIEILEESATHITLDGDVHFSGSKNNYQIGQFYKVQLAYKKGNETGIYSNVGIIKYAAPGVITRTTFEALGANCSLVYEPSASDPQETAYSYRFKLGKRSSSENDIFSEELLYNKDIEYQPYSFNKVILNTNNYDWLTCIVQTTNGLQIERAIELKIQTTEMDSLIDLEIENNYDTGTIEIKDIPSEVYINGDTEPAIQSKLVRNGTEILTQHISEYADKTVEQGVGYTYNVYIEQSTADASAKNISIKRLTKLQNNPIFADYEAIFLSDKNKQLAITFDPKVSSYKTVIQEQKQDTIGGQYPFILRNGAMNYKEFPISGLMSYHMDAEEKFMNKGNLNLESDTTRQETNKANSSSSSNIPTVQLTGYNIAAERRFKNAVLDWLNNGEPKLFRSPTEGCFIVRLTGVSLSPKDELGRMLHSFSATAHEIDEYNIQNLKKYNLI